VRARESGGVRHGAPVTDRHGGGRHCRRHGSVSKQQRQLQQWLSPT